MELIIPAAILIILFGILAIYFTFNFIEQLHKGDERVAKQSKFAALICFGVTMVISIGFGYLSLVFYLL